MAMQMGPSPGYFDLCAVIKKQQEYIVELEKSNKLLRGIADEYTEHLAAEESTEDWQSGNALLSKSSEGCEPCVGSNPASSAEEGQANW